MQCKYKIGIIGLGYVGLPIAVHFAKKYEVIGFDIDKKRIEDLKSNIDETCEVENTELEKTTASFTYILKDLQDINFYIITVPTPVNKNKTPDLSPLEKSSQMVAKVLGKDDIVVYESTVYPGATEEICIPILEKYSSLKFNKDFFVGYSPERINPGDKVHTLTSIKKVTSGSNEKTAKIVNDIYSDIITAGTFMASSIKVAEAAKVIENSQRDINIAFMNELAKIFHLMDIDTKDVLEAAKTKWNFLSFTPGLVGGHCIGVDPYYLTHKAEELGYKSEIILSGRRLNDTMHQFIASRITKLMIKNKISFIGAKALVLGITFKENCPDIRNSKVADLINEIKEYGLKVDIYDPLANAKEVKKEYKLELLPKIQDKYDVIILAVSHKQILTLDIKQFKKEHCVIYDIKSVLDESDERL
jgi:UDP-N-acetyl-D-galactosamine dehydrogenase